MQDPLNFNYINRVGQILGESEKSLVNVEHSLSLHATVPLDGVLQQAEWLLRDVLFIEELLYNPMVRFSHKLYIWCGAWSMSRDTG